MCFFFLGQWLSKKQKSNVADLANHVYCYWSNAAGSIVDSAINPATNWCSVSGSVCTNQLAVLADARGDTINRKIRIHVTQCSISGGRSEARTSISEAPRTIVVPVVGNACGFHVNRDTQKNNIIKNLAFQ